MKRIHLLCLMFFILLTYLLYKPSLNLDFYWDDYFCIKINSHLDDYKNIFRAFYDQRITNGDYVSLSEAAYRPLRTIYFILVCNIFGKNPLVFHFLSILLHLGVFFLLFKLLLRINYSNATIAFLFSCLFFFHPLHLENINFIGSSCDIFGAFFFLLVFNLILNSEKPVNPEKTLLLFVLLYLSVLSKEIFITTPFILTVLFFNNKFISRKYLILFNVISLIYLLQRYMSVPSITYTDLKLNLFYSIKYCFMTFFEYLKLTICPFDLLQIYPMPSINETNMTFNVLTGIFIIFIIGLIALRKYQLLLGLMIVIISCAPILNIIPLSSFVGNRLFYFPMLILIIIIYKNIPENILKSKSKILSGFLILLNLYSYGFALIESYKWNHVEKLFQASWYSSKHETALWNMSIIMMQKKQYREILDFYSANEINIPENNLPYYYMLLCKAAGYLGLEKDFLLFYNLMKESNVGKYGGEYLTQDVVQDFKRTVNSFNFDGAKKVVCDININK